MAVPCHKGPGPCWCPPLVSWTERCIPVLAASHLGRRAPETAAGSGVQPGCSWFGGVRWAAGTEPCWGERAGAAQGLLEPCAALGDAEMAPAQAQLIPAQGNPLAGYSWAVKSVWPCRPAQPCLLPPISRRLCSPAILLLLSLIHSKLLQTQQKWLSYVSCAYVSLVQEISPASSAGFVSFFKK